MRLLSGPGNLLIILELSSYKMTSLTVDFRTGTSSWSTFLGILICLNTSTNAGSCHHHKATPSTPFTARKVSSVQLVSTIQYYLFKTSVGASTIGMMDKHYYYH